MKTNRPLWAALLVAALMCTVPRTAPAAPKSLGYVPKDMGILIGLNLAPVRDQWIAKEVLTALRAKKSTASNLDQLKAATGFDVDKHIDELLIATAADFTKSQDFLIIARGKFDERKLIAYARKEGAKVGAAKHARRKYYRIDTDGALLFDRGIAVLGPERMVKAAIDAKNKSAPGFDTSPRMGQLEQVSGVAGVYFVGSLPADMQAELQRQSGQAIAGGYGSIDLKSGMDAKVQLELDSAKSAEALAALVRTALKEAARDTSIKQLGLDKVLGAARVSQGGAAVAIQVRLAEPELQRIVATFKNLLGAF